MPRRPLTGKSVDDSAYVARCLSRHQSLHLLVQGRWAIINECRKASGTPQKATLLTRLERVAVVIDEPVDVHVEGGGVIPVVNEPSRRTVAARPCQARQQGPTSLCLLASYIGAVLWLSGKGCENDKYPFSAFAMLVRSGQQSSGGRRCRSESRDNSEKRKDRFRGRLAPGPLGGLDSLAARLREVQKMGPFSPKVSWFASGRFSRFCPFGKLCRPCACTDGGARSPFRSRFHHQGHLGRVVLSPTDPYLWMDP